MLRWKQILRRATSSIYLESTTNVEKHKQTALPVGMSYRKYVNSRQSPTNSVESERLFPFQSGEAITNSRNILPSSFLAPRKVIPCQTSSERREAGRREAHRHGRDRVVDAPTWSRQGQSRCRSRSDSKLQKELRSQLDIDSSMV